jgi:hypothetical protein
LFLIRLAGLRAGLLLVGFRAGWLLLGLSAGLLLAGFCALLFLIGLPVLLVFFLAMLEHLFDGVARIGFGIDRLPRLVGLVGGRWVLR